MDMLEYNILDRQMYSSTVDNPKFHNMVYLETSIWLQHQITIYFNVKGQKY